MFPRNRLNNIAAVNTDNNITNTKLNIFDIPQIHKPIPATTSVITIHIDKGMIILRGSKSKCSTSDTKSGNDNALATPE